jgi:hypothetical protein
MNHIIEGVGGVVKTVESSIKPIRHSAFRRFPTLFALLTTFGFAATLFGMERVITSIEWLDQRPWLIIGVGILILVLTGRLHKKLD